MAGNEDGGGSLLEMWPVIETEEIGDTNIRICDTLASLKYQQTFNLKYSIKRRYDRPQFPQFFIY